MIEYVLAGLFGLFGVVSAVRSLSEPPAEEQGGDRVLMAVHDAARALFWLSLGGFFLAYGLAAGETDVRWLVMVPLVMAAVRLISAAFVTRA